MRILSVIVLASSVAGCGTLANLEGKRFAFISPPGEKPVRLYGGVRNDFEWVTEGVGIPESQDRCGDDSDSRSPALIMEDPIGVVCGIPVLGYFAVIDPVLSFVGDTVTLPHVVRLMRESARESNVDVANNARLERDP